jgi:hypothetical protein
MRTGEHVSDDTYPSLRCQLGRRCLSSASAVGWQPPNTGSPATPRRPGFPYAPRRSERDRPVTPAPRRAWAPEARDVNKEPDPSPTTSAALEGWRSAERTAVRATTRRETAQQAVEAATLAAEAARATADAADAAVAAAVQASRTANATAAAAERVLVATQTEGDARVLEERGALAAEASAKGIYEQARDQAAQRHANDDT